MDKNKNDRIILSPSLESVATMIGNRCQNDAAFNQNFRKNPQDALQQAFGINSSVLQFHLHDNDENNWHIVLPDLKVRGQVDRLLASGKSLNDEEIASIAGGEGGVALGVLVAIGIGILAVGSIIVAGGVSGGLKARDDKRKKRGAKRS